jgi:hypothetical protein
MEGIYAKFETTKGVILVELTHKKNSGDCRKFCEFSRGNSDKQSQKRRRTLL